MDEQPRGGRSARMRLAIAAVCSVAIAAGGVLTGTPASASACGPTSGLLSAVSTVTEVLGCTTTSGAQQTTPVDAPSATAPTPAPTPAPAPAPTSSPTTSSDASTDVSVSTVGERDDGPSLSASSASSASLARVTVSRSSNTVYPVKDGFRDKVRFGIWGLDAVGGSVPVTGVAVLTHAGAIVRTWDIGGPHALLTWDGRTHGKVRTGTFTLAVTAWSSDGSTVRGLSMVRVLSKHLVKASLVVRSDVGARSVSADLPKQLLQAYTMGEVYCRVRTDATVRGRGALVFSGGGVSRSVTLRNGVHTTKALPVPQGFSHVAITHRWKKGAVRLHSLSAIWTYSVLR